MTFNWDISIDELTAVNILLMENGDPDIRIIQASCDQEIHLLIQHHMGMDFVQTIVNNKDAATSPYCPFFRVIMEKFGNSQPINFKLASFYNRINMSSLNPRCKKAMIIGLMDLRCLDSVISVPSNFMTTTIDPLHFALDEVDLACLSPCAKDLYPDGYDLCDIAGLSIPVHLPWEVQWNIISFLRSPTAQLIDEKMTELCHDWDVHVMPMFQQREPRIPANIAFSYNAATVQTAIAGATKPFLVRPARIWASHVA
jgi:hypothetical protein